MLIDWFTVGAQVVNFIILLVLLRVFLYRPVMDAMDRREERITSRIEEARRKEEEAESERRAFEEKREGIEQEKDEILNNARKEAEERRETLVREAREEADALAEKWKEGLRRERDALVAELRRKTGEQVCAVARRALSVLADAELQERMFAVFQKRLQADGALDELFEEDGGRPLEVYSSFELNGEARNRVKDAVLAAADGEPDLSFKTDRTLICGLELRAGGRSIGWSVSEYLDDLERQFLDVLAEVERREEEQPESGDETDGADGQEQGQASENAREQGESEGDAS